MGSETRVDGGRSPSHFTRFQPNFKRVWAQYREPQVWNMSLSNQRKRMEGDRATVRYKEDIRCKMSLDIPVPFNSSVCSFFCALVYTNICFKLHTYFLKVPRFFGQWRKENGREGKYFQFDKWKAMLSDPTPEHFVITYWASTGWPDNIYRFIPEWEKAWRNEFTFHLVWAMEQWR